MAEDIVLVLLAHAGVAAGSGRVAEPFSERLQALLLHSLGLPVDGELPPAPSPDRVYQSLMTMHRGGSGR